MTVTSDHDDESIKSICPSGGRLLDVLLDLARRGPRNRRCWPKLQHDLKVSLLQQVFYLCKIVHMRWLRGPSPRLIVIRCCIDKNRRSAPERIQVCHRRRGGDQSKGVKRGAQ